MDYPCLPQLPRNHNEEATFKAALESMELMYAHDWTGVLRVDTAAPPGVNPYHLRGWCASYGEVIKTPDEFNKKLDATVFTNGHTDRALVKSLYYNLCVKKVQTMEVLSVVVSEAEAPRLAVLLPQISRLKQLTVHPATPVAALSALDAIDAALSRGALKKLQEFTPLYSKQEGMYTSEAWPKLMAIFRKMKGGDTLWLHFHCHGQFGSRDAEAYEFADFLENAGMPKLKKLVWYGDTGSAGGLERLRGVAGTRGIELN